ncbi:MAG: nucleotidyltransferase domain-containing protein [Anaerolineae bacterium]
MAQLIPLFEREGVLLAYLFGSLSREQEGHDVDLAILTRSGPAFRLRAAINHCLETERVDLVDLRRVSPVLRFEILRTGRLLYAVDQALSERFELATLRLYRDTAWLRRQQRVYLQERMEVWSSDVKPSNSG